jgi:branched-chain amino acid transport system permease protein
VCGFVVLAGGFADGAGAQETTTTPTTAAAPGGGDTGDGAALRGTLRVGREPVEGVRVTVSRDGTEIGTATSDASGEWRVAVPERGTYQVTLDTETLPEGITAARPELSPVVRGERAQTVLFRLTSGDEPRRSTGPSRWERLLNLLVSGIRFGLIIGLCAVGLSMIYGTTGLVNFAHGELVTFGALMAWLFNTMSTGPKLDFFLAAAIAVVISGALGAVLEVGLFRPMVHRRTGAVARMLVSIGLALFLRYIYQVMFTGNSRGYRQYSAPRAVEFGPLVFPARDYYVMLVCLVTLVAVGLVLKRSRMGTAIRAVSNERDLAAASGIDVQRVVLIVWISGAMLAGFGGVLLALSQSVQWNLGFRLLLTMFAAVVLGGLGSPYGAMAGGLLVGVAAQVSTYWLDADLQFATALMILILVLIVRPQGLLGVRERIG